jgi:hypothetical protein
VTARAGAARARDGGSPTPSPDGALSLEGYAGAAAVLGLTGVITAAPNRPGTASGAAGARVTLPPMERTHSAPEPARTVSDQGMPAAVVARGSGVPSSVAAGVVAAVAASGATVVASPIVDPDTGSPLQHFYAEAT